MSLLSLNCLKCKAEIQSRYKNKKYCTECRRKAKRKSDKMYLKNNPEAKQLKHQNKMRREEGIKERIHIGEWRQRIKDCHNQCMYCGSKATPDNRLTMEHIIPINRNGSHKINNIGVACLRCNVDKNDKTLDEYAAELWEKACL